MWAAGDTSTAIALEFGVTRNAVIGVINRLGLVRNPGSSKAIGRKFTRSSIRKPAPVVAKQPKQVLKLAPKPVRVEHVPLRRTVEQPSTGAPVRLMDLKFGDCKWPIGDPKHDDFRFCGQRRREGRPYCQDHCRLAYREPEHATRRRLPPADVVTADNPSRASADFPGRVSERRSARPGLSHGGEGV